MANWRCHILRRTAF